MSMPEMHLVSSSNIASVGYDAENQWVYVQFLDSSMYAYKGVPQHEFEKFAKRHLLLGLISIETLKMSILTNACR